MKKRIFTGIATAVVTPFKNGKIDLDALEIMLRRQISAGISAIVVLGTTGEPETLTYVERKKIILKTMEVCNGKIKVVVGCGSNSTKVAKRHYRQAQALGADGALIVTPYYNKCTQNGLIEHYKSISNCGNLPIIVYNVPSRTGLNILPETLKEIAEIKNVCGIKEASGNIAQIVDYFNEVGEKIAIYSGEDSLNNVFAMLGGSGAISVLSNITPATCEKLFNLAKYGDMKEANKLSNKLLSLTKALFCEVNPIPVKAGLSYLGLCRNELRAPLTKIEAKNFENLKSEINKAMLI